MMTKFLVQLYKKDVRQTETVFCHSKEDLSNLILHLDTQNYAIGDIVTLNITIDDFATVCQKDKDLELGKN
jgi:hypothetical protein